MTLPVVYLAGAIRLGPDGRMLEADAAWREEAARRFAGLALVLNPLAAEAHDALAADRGRHLVHRDFYGIDRADVIVWNLLALADGYPCVGSLIEFGRASSGRALRYVVVPEGFRGHQAATIVGPALHPFLVHNSAAVFTDISTCLTLVRRMLPYLSGSLQGTIRADAP